MDVNQLAAAISKDLQDYSDTISEKIGEVVEIVANEVNVEIKSHITFKQPTGKYVKAFRVKKITTKSKYNHSRVWYVANPHYRLTHLLEHGHALRNGGRARAFPHIQFGEELAQRRMQELSEKAVQDAGR
jgi:chlorite dismutase